MTTSLQFLHQNLYDLKYCKLQENEKFRELYDEAKSYEKNANLSSLVSKNINDKLVQETNFYIILIKMLNELKNYEDKTDVFTNKMEKVYSWYILNKKVNPKDKEKLLKRNTRLPPKEAVQTQTTYVHDDKNLLSFRTDNALAAESLANPSQSSILSKQPSVHLPNVLSKPPINDLQRSTSSLNRRKQKQEYGQIEAEYEASKLPDLVRKPLPTPNSTKQLSYSSSESYQNTINASNTQRIRVESTEKMSEQNRIGILKALSQYANKLYTSLDTGYTKKLQAHLNSLSKFYHALDEESATKIDGYYDMTKFFTVKDKSDVLTVNSLVDMAKQVSDKMILYKAETVIRQNEYKMTLENSQVNAANPVDKETETKEAIDKMLKNSSKQMIEELPVYSVAIKNTKRPKSTPYMDWRGHVSRPGTTHTSSSFKLIPTYKRSKSSTLNPDETDGSDLSDIEIEDDLNKEYEEFIREKTKPMRRKSIKTLKQSALKGTAETTSTTDAKEVKFLNFCKKMEEVEKGHSTRRIASAKTYAGHVTWESRSVNGRILSTIKSQTDRIETAKSAISNDQSLVDERALTAESPSIDIRSNGEEKNHKEPEEVKVSVDQEISEAAAITPAVKSIEASPTNEPVDQKDNNVIEDNVSDSTSHYNANDREIKQIEMYQCLADDAIMCECLMHNNTQNEHPTTPMTPQNDIFHLTAGEDTDENGVSVLIKKRRSIDFTQEEAELIPQASLREILLNNYNPRFAKKIGIVDFVPIEVMNGQTDPNAKPLEFIPFENIDRKYPKNKGKPTFNPSHHEQPKILYRTNPSIPRPESKYGTRSGVYEQILALKQASLDTKALVVYEPEDVLLVRDLLQLEAKPLNDTLQCLPMRTNEEIEEMKRRIEKYPINMNMTPMGRPVNVHPQIRWRQLEAIVKDEKETEKEADNYLESTSAKQRDKEFTDVSKYSFITKEHSEAESLNTGRRNIHFKLTGNSYVRSDSGRPIPHVLPVEDPQKSIAQLSVYNEAKKSVHIPTLFKEPPASLIWSIRDLYSIKEGSVIHNYVKELNLEERLKREEERKAAVKIQQQFRKHLKNKREIEKATPLTPETLNWMRNQKLELKKRKQEKENILRIQEQMLIKENLKLRNTLKHIGMHNDLFEILFHKGPEYTNGVLNEAATCIQRWVKGWLIRKEFTRLKNLIIADGTSWSSFIRHYRKTFKRILIMRGDHNRTQFDFKVNEAVEFYRKEKKYLSYYQKLCFVDQLDHNDLEKLFHYNDLYPSASELKEAKEQVLKYYKKKTTSNTFPKNVVFDIIYYIYPPLVTKLKTTRKSTWTNPIVGNEDALRLRGHKFIEETNYEQSWQLVARSTIQYLNAINKNTPEALDIIANLNNTPRPQ